MNIVRNICLFILLALSFNVKGQQVTFQSYIETSPWIEQVLLNGNPLVMTGQDTFEISPLDVLPGSNILEFVPKPVIISSGGVKASDISLLRKALTETVTLDPNAIISADVNQSNFIGVEDMLLLFTTILGLNQSGFDFVIVHSGIDLSALDIFDFGFDVYKFSFEGSDIDNIDFLFDVHLTGDVNKDANFKSEENLISEVRSEDLILSLDNKEFNTGEHFEIPFRFSSDKNFEGLQLGLKNNGIVIESIELEDSEVDIYINNEIEAQTRFIIMSDRPEQQINGTLVGTSFINAKSSDIISVSTDFEDEAVYDDFSVSRISIEFQSTSSTDNIVSDNLLISPNPIQDYFSIQVPSDLWNGSSFTITNPQGKVVMQEKALKGNLTLNRSDLGAAGLYMLTWMHGDERVTKKLIVL